MASLLARTRKDGTEYYAVLYRLGGKQTSTSFDNFYSASKFCDLATKVRSGERTLDAEGRHHAGDTDRRTVA